MSISDDKTMAIIKSPLLGVGDRGGVTLSFSTYVTEGSAALQIFNMTEAETIIEAYGVSDVKRLAGKACWVDTSRNGLISWIGPCVIR